MEKTLSCDNDILKMWHPDRAWYTFRRVIQCGPVTQVFSFVIELKEEACCLLACLFMLLVFSFAFTLACLTFLKEDLKKPRRVFFSLQAMVVMIMVVITR